jgi:hypothetical protein
MIQIVSASNADGGPFIVFRSDAILEAGVRAALQLAK